MWRWVATTTNYLIKQERLKICLNIRTFSTKKKWNVLFFGTDDFSLASLKEIHKEYVSNGIVNKLEVVTNKNLKNSISKFANQHNLVQNDWPIIDSLGNSFHLGIVVSFGHLIPKAVIESFPLGMINVHASLLPRWRGAAPIIHCLLNGDSTTGVTIMKIKPKHFDIGDMISQKSIQISNDILQPQLHKILASMGSKMLLECLHNLPECLDNAIPQNNQEAVLAPKVNKSISVIVWNKSSALEIYNLSRALYDVLPLLTKFKSHLVNLKDLYLWDNNSTSDDNISRKPGQLEYVKSAKVIKVWCNNNRAVYFKKIKIKGKSEMSALEFRNGFMKNLPIEEQCFESCDFTV